MNRKSVFGFYDFKIASCYCVVTFLSLLHFKTNNTHLLQSYQCAEIRFCRVSIYVFFYSKNKNLRNKQVTIQMKQLQVNELEEKSKISNTFSFH